MHRTGCQERDSGERLWEIHRLRVSGGANGVHSRVFAHRAPLQPSRKRAGVSGGTCERAAAIRRPAGGPLRGEREARRGGCTCAHATAERTRAGFDQKVPIVPWPPLLNEKPNVFAPASTTMNC